MQYFLILAVLAISVGGVVVNGEVHKVNNNYLNSPVWSVQFEYPQINMTMTNSQKVYFLITDIEPSWGRDFDLHLLCDNNEVVYIDRVEKIFSDADGKTRIKGNFTVNAILLGHTKVYVELQRIGYESEKSEQSMRVIVIRSMRMCDIVFNICVGILVLALYVNFGAALDLADLKRIVTHPIGPAIGLFCQFVVMPLLSFLIGYFLFREMIEIRLGLFFLGVSPAGGSSNMFAVLLNGNLNLSVTMTAISNLAAFGMMPLWIFTLGASIFSEDSFIIPYKSIVTVSCTFVVPITAGIIMQKYAPEITKKFSKLLKPISLFLIITATIFGAVFNSYMFKLFSWKILIASSLLPWFGYVIGWLIATVLRQPPKDAITIAIETGIQNIGIAVFMLIFALPQPQADMTTIVPLTNSLVTPLPLLLIYFLKLCFCRNNETKRVEEEAISKREKEIELVAMIEKGSEKDDTKSSK